MEREATQKPPAAQYPFDSRFMCARVPTQWAGVRRGLGKKASLFPAGGGEPRALTDHARAVVALVFSWKGDRLATVEEGGKVRVWDPSSGKLFAELPDAITGEVHAVAFAPDGKLLAGAGGDTATGELVRSYPLPR
jgi:WD40 repeat protein